MASLLEEISRGLAQRSSTRRNLIEIDHDFHANRLPEGQALLETLNFLWNRVLLRTCLRVRDALRLLFHCSNTTNAYGCALAARGIIENVALLQHLAKRVPWHDSPTYTVEALKEFVEEILVLTYGSTFDWDKLLDGKLSMRDVLASGEWKRPREKRIGDKRSIIPHISDLVAAMGEEFSTRQRPEAKGFVQLIYSALCDVVHPSWGGDFIYAPKMYREMRAEAPPDDHFKKVSTLLCLPMVGVVKHFLELIKFMMENEPRILLFEQD